MSESSFSHIDESGKARMVDVGGKMPTRRTARAEARVRLGSDIAGLLSGTGQIAKGNVIETARIAGIMAAKRTADIIPMCHPLNLEAVEIDLHLEGDDMIIQAEVRTTGATGVEMEAMTAVTVAALTVYDMCKSASKGIRIEAVRLLSKSGGKSGEWRACEE